MFRAKLICGSAIALMLLGVSARVNAAESEAPMTEVSKTVRSGTVTCSIQAEEEAPVNIEAGDGSDTGDIELDSESDYGDPQEKAIEGSTYGKIEQKIIKKNPDISISLDYGIDGYAIYDSGSQVIVRVHTDVDVAGKLSIQPSYDENYSDQIMVYSQEVALEAGADSEFKFYINGFGYGRMLVKLVDEQEKEIYAESDMLSVNGYEMMSTVGVLSDNMQAFENLEDARVKNQTESVNVRKLNMNAAQFPDDLQGLDVVHYMLIDDYDTKKLSEVQMDTIQEWILDGGTLILGLGANAEKVLGGFDRTFLRYTIDGTVDKDIHIWSDKGKSTDFRNTVVANVAVDGSETNDSLGGACELDSGYGRIIVLPYSLADMDVTESSDGIRLTEMVLKDGYTDRVNALVQGSFYDSASGYGITNAINANQKKKISPVILIIILSIYLIICGPVTYVVLRRLKKSEFIWIAVPAWALIGTFSIYMVSKKYRVTKPLELTFTSADITDDVMRQNVYTYILGSKAGSYSMDVNNEYNNIRVMDGYYAGSSETQTLNVEKITGESGVGLKFKTHVPFGGMSLEANGVMENDIGRFGGTLKLFTDGLEGEVVNNTSYDMRNVVIMTDGYYYCLDSLKAGEAVNVSRSQNRRMINGMSVDCMKGYYINKYGKNYSIDEDAETMMARNYYMLLRLGGYTSTKSGMGRIAMWATIDRDSDVGVDKRSEKYGSYVVYDIHTQDYEDVDGAYYSNIYTRNVNRFDQADYDTDDLMMYSDEVDVSIRFRSDDDISTLVRAAESNDSASSKVVVQAYNYETGDYDEIFANGSSEISGSRLEPYIQNGEMELEFIAPHQGDTYTETYLPRISARGGEQQ